MYLRLIKEKNYNQFYDTPFYTYISLSNICNANCEFCDVRKNIMKKNSIDVKRLILELSELGTKYVHFTGGGEPFVNDDIYEYLEYANNLGIKIVLISNGYNLNEEKIKRLSNLNIVAFFFSIDSCKKEIHDSLRGIKGLFEKATENINILKKYMPNTKVVLNHVINSKNISDFLEFIKMKERVNFDYINPIIIKDCERLFPSKSQIENYKKNIELFKDTAKCYDIEFLCQDIDFFKSDVQDNGDREYNTLARCVYPSFCSFIDCPTGLVYPCDCSIHRDRELYCIGSLHDNTFKEIWNGEKRKNLKKLLYRGMLDCPLKCDEANCLFNKNYFKKEVNNEEDISNC